MSPDRVSNLRPLALESDALQTALHGLAKSVDLTRLLLCTVCYAVCILCHLKITEL